MSGRAARRREPQAVAAALREWLRDQPGYADAELGEITRPAGAGLSNETYLIDCVNHGRTEALVLQVGPAGGGLFRDYDLGVMARVQQQLAAVSTVPVARVRWYEADAQVLGAPFYVMERVPGRVPGDNPSYHVSGWFAELPAVEQAAAWDSGITALVALHRLDPRADGFDFLCDAPWGMPFTADAAATRLAQWRDFLAWGARDRLDLLEQALNTLDATRPPPAALRVSWGDAKLSNCVIAGGAVHALLDWELCGLSVPEEDLAFWLLLDWAQWKAPGVQRLPALPSPRATVAHYEALAGHATRDVLWWFKFGQVRLAIIYHRFIARRIELGRLAGDVDVVALNPMCALLPGVLALEDLP